MASELELDFDDEGEAVPQNIAECPAPGIYHDVPFETYAGWRAVNSGIVKWLTISPKHGHAAFLGELKSDDTRSMKLGRAIHCMLLEPETFEERFVVAQKCGATTKEGKPCTNNGIALSGGEWRCGVHGKGLPKPETDVITADEVARCKAVNAALKEHWAIKLIRRKGWSEVSVVWEYAGLPMKCRLDRYAPEGKRPMVIDVKKCRVGRGGIDFCERAIRDYSWHVQAAMYVEAIHRQTGVRPEFIWVFVEDGPPFDVSILPASAETLKVGWHVARSAIQRYTRRLKEDDLHGYIQVAEQIRPGGLPLWYLRECEQAGWLNEADDATA